MQTDLEKVHDYMLSINCIDKFIHNYKNLTFDQADRIAKCRYPVSCAFMWKKSLEGHEYWRDISTAIIELNINLSAHDIYEYLVNCTETIQKDAYEYW